MTSTPSSSEKNSAYEPQPIVITALDGFLLSGTLYLPSGPINTSAPKTKGPSSTTTPLSDLSVGATLKPEVDALTRVVIISSATATIQDFYYKFALYLSQELGMIVVTYDNRGVGRSMPGDETLAFMKAEIDNQKNTASGSGLTHTSTPPPLPPKPITSSPNKSSKPKKNPLIGFEATIVDWGTKDLPGVFSWVLEYYPHNPTIFTGHSVGGHLLPSLDSYYTRNLERVFFVAVTSAYWRNMNSPLFIYWFFYMASPLINKHYGYYPGKTLWNSMEDLPKGCFETWSYWGSFSNYMLGGNPEWKPNFDLFRVPVYSIYFSDDDFSSISAPFIMDLIPNTQRRCVGVDPVQDLNMKKVGHMGFFFNQCKQKLWKTVVKSWFVDGQGLDRETISEQAKTESSYARL
ncbi:hypothetical protein BGZ93_003433 [Podila epicladia]|nr:hypothetical protein BGZ92_011014 [Podila epicladia]KAG0097101.1 hypothetical protein BGZ93_003433 [Podila epicladia]